MTQLEERLRRELQDIAQRLASADLRPLQEPRIRYWTRRARWLAPVASMAAIALVAGGLTVAGHAWGSGQAAPLAPGQRPPGRHALPDPAFAVISGETPKGLLASVRLISPRTGHLIKILANLDLANGFALSPDSKNLYAGSLVDRAIEIRKISVATGHNSFVADGVYPAVSPDSRFLAYATGRQFDAVAVRNLRTGSTRTIDLRQLMGKDASLLNQGTVTWLGDGREILAVPQPDGIGGVGGVPPPRLKGTPCGLQDSPRGLCIIVVRIGSGGLSAQPVYVPRRWSSAEMLISGDNSARRSFLIARTGFRSAGAIDEVTLKGAGVVARLVAALPVQALPDAFSPDGDRILYIQGHTPPSLWVGTIRNGRLTNRHRLLTDNHQFGVGGAAW